MAGYYTERLAAERLRQCYEIAPPRTRQYLEAEIAHVVQRIRPSDTVLELGCGYGRVLRRLAGQARMVVGIDTSHASLELATHFLVGIANWRLVRMDAGALGFRDGSFDVVVCVQNGISALRVEPRRLLAESVRVTRPAGRVLFSSYAAGFWEERLAWFQLQSAQGLLGEIDWAATGAGVIVCKDGFRASTVGPDEFRALAAGLGRRVEVEEVDGSSVFCEIAV